MTAFHPSPWPRPWSPGPEPCRPSPSSSSRSCAASSACCWPCCWGRQATMRSASCSDFSPYSRGTWSLESSALGSPALPSHPSSVPTEARIRSLPMPGPNYGRGARAAAPGFSEALGGAVYSWLPQVERRSVRKPGGWQGGAKPTLPEHSGYWPAEEGEGVGTDWNIQPKQGRNGVEKSWPWPRERACCSRRK